LTPEDGNIVDRNQRREFLAECSSAALCSFAAALAGGEAMANTGPAPGGQARRSYPAALLVDERGAPFNGRSLQPRTNYLFHFPFVATPCLLIDLARDVGGVGLGRSIVAFSAICSHQLAYPAKEVSFIRFQAKASTHSEAERIHCCAIELSYDAKTGNLTATGLRGTDQFDAFFRKYDFKLGMEFGGRARDLVGRTSQLQELTRFCRNVAQC